MLHLTLIYFLMQHFYYKLTVYLLISTQIYRKQFMILITVQKYTKLFVYKSDASNLTSMAQDYANYNTKYLMCRNTICRKIIYIFEVSHITPSNKVDKNKNDK